MAGERKFILQGTLCELIGNNQSTRFELNECE